VEQPETFGRVVEFIEGKMMPIVVRHAVSGVASINSEDLVFEDPAALAMLIDVFSERGFHTTVDVTRVGAPFRIDLQTGEIYSHEKKVFRFSVRFRNAEIRGWLA
jgi:adenylate kinase